MERDYYEKMPLAAVVVVELAVGWVKPIVVALEMDWVVD